MMGLNCALMTARICLHVQERFEPIVRAVEALMMGSLSSCLCC